MDDNLMKRKLKEYEESSGAASQQYLEQSIVSSNHDINEESPNKQRKKGNKRQKKLKNLSGDELINDNNAIEALKDMHKLTDNNQMNYSTGDNFINIRPYTFNSNDDFSNFYHVKGRGHQQAQTRNNLNPFQSSEGFSGYDHNMYAGYNQDDVVVKKEFEGFGNGDEYDEQRHIIRLRDKSEPVPNPYMNQFPDFDSGKTDNHLNSQEKKIRKVGVVQCPKCKIMLGSKGALRYHTKQKVCERRYIRNSSLNLENDDYFISEIATTMANAGSKPLNQDSTSQVPGKLGNHVSPNDENKDDEGSSIIDNSVNRSQPCDKCGRTFTSTQGLKYHLRKGVCEKRRIKEELAKQQPQLLKVNGTDGVLVYIPSYLVTSQAPQDNYGEPLQIPIQVPPNTGNKAAVDNSSSSTSYLTMHQTQMAPQNNMFSLFPHEHSFGSNAYDPDGPRDKAHSGEF